MAKELAAFKVGNVGEKSVALGPMAPGSRSATVVFIRCQALVHIQMEGFDSASVAAYAARLDERLAAHVCP